MRRLVCMLLVAACKPGAPAPGGAAPAPAPPVATTAAAPSHAAPTPEPTVEREGGEAMTGELAREAEQRPTGTPTAEAVLDALEKNGIHIERRRQVSARPVEASYCLTGLLADGASAAVCEYPDETAAARGKQVSLDKFKMLPPRQIFVNRKTTLTLMRADDIAEKIATIFAGL